MANKLVICLEVLTGLGMKGEGCLSNQKERVGRIDDLVGALAMHCPLIPVFIVQLFDITH